MITVETLPRLVLDRGYAVMADTYSTRAEGWREFIPASSIMVPSADNMIDFPFGSRMVGHVGTGALKRFKPGERIQRTSVAEGYARQVALHQVGESMEVPDELLEARGADVRVLDRVVDWIGNVNKAATRFRNDYIGGILQKGTIAAGNDEYFDNSYDGTADPNKGLIYDGKPLFAASGNAHPYKYATAGSGDLPAAAGVNLTVSAVLSTTTLQSAYVIMSQTNAFDERGQKTSVRPRYVVGGPSIRQLLVSTVESSLLPGSANNDTNAYNGIVQPIVWDELSDAANAWWLIAEDPGLDVYDSGAPILDSYRDHDRRTTVFTGYIRFGAVVRDWRGMYCANKATS